MAMRMAKRVNARRRGFTLIEVLVAALLLAIALMAMVQMWAYSYNVTNTVDDTGVAYNLGRQAVETVKMNGFDNQAEGSTTSYYTGSEVSQTTSATARFGVTTSVVSSSVSSGTAGSSGAVPALHALRTVTITVKRLADNAALYTTNTYLTKGGI